MGEQRGGENRGIQVGISLGAAARSGPAYRLPAGANLRQFGGIARCHSRGCGAVLVFNQQLAPRSRARSAAAFGFGPLLVRSHLAPGGSSRNVPDQRGARVPLRAHLLRSGRRPPGTEHGGQRSGVRHRPRASRHRCRAAAASVRACLRAGMRNRASGGQCRQGAAVNRGVPRRSSHPCFH